MGYNVYITRKENWHDEEGPAISIEEWAAFIRSDPEMRLEVNAEPTVGNDGCPQIENSGVAVWTAYPSHENDGNMSWFYFANGNITVKNPDQEILKKMWSMAKTFSAKVQGDDGECYDADGIMIEQRLLLFGFRATNSKGETVTDRIAAESAAAAWSLLDTQGYNDITLLDNEFSAINPDDSQTSLRLKLTAGEEQELRGMKSMFAQICWTLARKQNAILWGPLLIWNAYVVKQHGLLSSHSILPAGLLLVYILWFVWANVPSVMYERVLEASAWYRWSELEHWLTWLQRWKNWFKTPMPDHEIQFRAAKAEAGTGRIEDALRRIAPFATSPDLVPGYYHSQLASLFFLAGDYQQMLSNRREAFRLNPSETTAIDLAVSLTRWIGDHEASRTLLEDIDVAKLIPLAKMFVFYCHGLIELNTTHPDKACGYFEDVLDLGRIYASSPEVRGFLLDARAHYALALVATGRSMEAEAHFAAARPILIARGDTALIARFDSAKNRPGTSL